MQAMTKSGDELQLSGDLQLEIDTTALGMSPENVDDTATWQMDEDTGFWKNPVPLTGGGGGNSRKKRQTLNPPLLSVLQAGVVNYWNMDAIRIDQLCRVVVVPYDFFGVEPVSGIQIEVHSLVSRFGLGRYRDVQTTDADGKACAWVECGNNFEIFASSGDYDPTNNHCLPQSFIFQNALDTGIMHIYGLAPTATTRRKFTRPCSSCSNWHVSIDCQAATGLHMHAAATKFSFSIAEPTTRSSSNYSYSQWEHSFKLS